MSLIYGNPNSSYDSSSVATFISDQLFHTFPFPGILTVIHTYRSNRRKVTRRNIERRRKWSRRVGVLWGLSLATAGNRYLQFTRRRVWC
ncbi:hypothetical protein M426DRAFT_203441 [Hypoxylon sp. CI-4A]|nr:hypothetical protein M426DRAFT_203441 [Hypoxylon sp. CI-4A]